MCLFRGEIRWMENFGEKIGRKTFLSMFGWMGRKENKWWGPCVFFLDPPKSFLLKIEKKLKGKIGYHFWTKMPMCNYIWASSMLLFFPPFFFFFFFSTPRRCLPFLFFTKMLPASSSFFLLIYWAGVACLFFFCVYLFRCDFFLWTWFLFFNKFRWLIFFLVIYHFLFIFLIRHYF